MSKSLRDYQRSLRKYATPSEKRFKRVLSAWSRVTETRWVFQQIFYAARSFIADFWVPQYRLVFEIDGRHHKTDPEQVELDRVRDAWMAKRKIKVVRIENHETESEERLYRIIHDATRGRRRKLAKKLDMDSVRRLEKASKKVTGLDGIEITICPPVSERGIEIGEGKVMRPLRNGKRKVFKCKKEPPGMFAGSVLWKG